MTDYRHLPIVLAHGIAPFDALSAAMGRGFYFKGVAKALRQSGFGPVFEPSVDFSGALSVRAFQLAKAVHEILGQTGAKQVHIIAHSMGGLDARFAIVEEGLGAGVASLTTVGTPHWGTPFADYALGLAGDAIAWLKGWLDLRGFQDLAVEPCERFNQHAEAAEAANSVRYTAYASWQLGPQVLAALQGSWSYLKQHSGANDGLVPVSSQSWTPVLRAPSGQEKVVHQKTFPMRADHLNQLGWWHVEQLSGGWGWDNNRRDYELAIRQLYVSAAHDACVAAG